MEPVSTKPSGLLHTASRQDKMTLALYPSSHAELEPYIEHYWIVRWDLRGREPYASENLPHPSVHMAFEQEQSYIVGVLQEKFTRVLRDQGFVCGIKFRPGAFYPFFGRPVQQLSGRYTPVRDVFGPEISALEDRIRSAGCDRDMVEPAEAFLLEHLPAPDRTLDLVRTLVEAVRADRTITTVDTLAARNGLSPRMVQRLFMKYAGVNPKWVIQRYRLLEAADQLAKGHPGSWPELAASVGYYDQSHFIRDFRSMVGHSPEEYVRLNYPGAGS